MICCRARSLAQGHLKAGRSQVSTPHSSTRHTAAGPPCPWHQAFDSGEWDKDKDPAPRGEAPNQPVSGGGRRDEDRRQVAKRDPWGPERHRQCRGRGDLRARGRPPRGGRAVAGDGPSPGSGPAGSPAPRTPRHFPLSRSLLHPAPHTRTPRERGVLRRDISLLREQPERTSFCERLFAVETEPGSARDGLPPGLGGRRWPDAGGPPARTAPRGTVGSCPAPAGPRAVLGRPAADGPSGRPPVRGPGARRREQPSDHSPTRRPRAGRLTFLCWGAGGDPSSTCPWWAVRTGQRDRLTSLER